MNLISSRVNRALLGVLALALVPLLAPGAANAEIRNWTDSKHDVWKVSFTDSLKPSWSKAHHVRNADISHVMVRYAAKHLVIKERFVDLKRTDKPLILAGMIRTSTGKFGVWTIAADPTEPHGSAFFGGSTTGPRGCRVVHSLNYEKNRARISIPSRCLNNPRWVKMKLVSEILVKLKFNRRHFHLVSTFDDALSKGHSVTTWSPHIHHHHPHR